jgi:hypothetical protein
MTEDPPAIETAGEPDSDVAADTDADTDVEAGTEGRAGCRTA